jgi:ribosomal protein S18 acetylase RimI-like enzyme
MNDIAIEYFRLKHIQEVAALETVSYSILPEPLVHEAMTGGRAWGMSLIAIEDKAIVGYLEGSWFFEPKACRGNRSLYIMAVAVDGRFRRRTQGIAERLLTGTFAHAVARGARSFHLRVQVENQSAIDLYQSLGFEVRVWLSDAYGPGEDGLLMVRATRIEDRPGAPPG